MEVSRVIFEATAVCLQSFTDCLAVEALMTDEWAENRLADFNLWVSGIGASARGRASLDSRMALKPEAREVIANLLRLLAGVVDECKKLALSETTNLLSESSHDGELRGRLATLSPEEPPARSFSPWSDDSASDTQSETEFKPLSSGNPLRENMQNIEMMLDQLSRIAVAVRRSGRRSRLQKADQRFKSEEHEDLQKHLITILLARPEFSKEQIEPSKLSKVQQRLIYCNLKRRNRFLYAQQHSKWLDPDTAGRPIETIGTRPPTDGEAAKEKQKKPSSEATDARINPTIRTGTSASAVSDSLALPQALIPAPAASTVMSSTVIDIKYPSPPKIKEGARVFACPCCCQTLPVNLSEENRWKKHVADDLSPYTCILPECVKPEVLFVTKEIWRQHLLKEHRSFEYWVCFACGDGTQLHSEDAFTIHTRTKHAASVPPDQISLLTNICRRTAPIEIRSCPLCNWPEGEEGEVDKDVLLDHIAKDIHSFSLRALPWADDNGQETDERINHSADKVYDWLIKNNLSENPDKERPSREKKVYTSEYFQRNAYFASSSVASSSSELESVASWEEELKKWKQKESSVAFGSRGSDVLSREEADNENVSYLQVKPYGAIENNELSANEARMPYVGQGKLGEDEAIYRQVLEGREKELGREHQDTLTSVSQLGLMLFRQGEYEEAESMHRRAVEGREKALGLEHPDTLTSIGNLGFVLLSQGKYKEAEAMYRRELEGCEKVLGPEHIDTLTSVSKLGLMLAHQDKYKEAESMHRRALEGREKVLGPEHPDTLTSVSNLGLALESQGKYEAAEAMHRRALEIREKVLRPEHLDTLTNVNNLGLVLESQGKYEEAKAMYRRALEIREKVLGPEHPDTLTSVSNLGSVLSSQGKYEEAEPMHRRDLEISEKVLGLEHPHTLTSVSNLGSVLSSQGKYEEAEPMHRRALETREKVLGPEHPNTLTSVSNLGLVLESQGKYEEAEAMHQRDLEGSEKVLGPEHPDTLTSVSNLGSVLKRQGKYEAAEAMHRRALKGYKKVLGAEHPSTLTSMANLASTYRGQGRWKEAEDLEVQVIEMGKRVLGEEHPSMLTSMANLASTYRGQGRWKEAEELEVQVIETGNRVLGEEHPSTLTSMANLALTYRGQGRWKEAEELGVQVIEMEKRVLGEEHPDTLTSMNNLALTFKAQGHSNEATSLMEKCFQLRKQVLGPQHPYTTSSLKALNKWQLEVEL